MITRNIRYFIPFLGIIAQVGCSSSSNNPATSGACSAHPPANINITLCASISGSSDQTKVDQCGTCCTTGGYSVSSFINNDQCTCSNPMNDADAGVTVCAAQTASSDACSSCCTNASYMSSGWVGNTSCQCSNKFDKSICSSTLTQPSPDTACICCCLNNGYVNYMYVGIGTPECDCING